MASDVTLWHIQSQMWEWWEVIRSKLRGLPAAAMFKGNWVKIASGQFSAYRGRAQLGNAAGWELESALLCERNCNKMIQIEESFSCWWENVRQPRVCLIKRGSSQLKDKRGCKSVEGTAQRGDWSFKSKTFKSKMGKTGSQNKM